MTPGETILIYNFFGGITYDQIQGESAVAIAEYLHLDPADEDIIHAISQGMDDCAMNNEV